MRSVHYEPLALYEALLTEYGPQGWWPGQSPFEVIVGAILTQNTAWRNVKQALDNLRAADLLRPQALHTASEKEVKHLIAPSGFFNVKYERLSHTITWLLSHPDWYRYGRSAPLHQLREELLGVHGIGPETADSILLYAFERPSFVVDAYTRRILRRLGLGWAAKASYDRLRSWFMEHLPQEQGLYNEYHALIVAHCKATCTKRDPRCKACRLIAHCPGASQTRND